MYFVIQVAAYDEVISSLKVQAKKDKEAKKKLTEAYDHLDTFYANEVANNPVPQTYLYAAYERRFRFFKLLQMFQKLAIIIVTIFVPKELFSSAKLIVGNAVVGFFALLTLMSRPFQDDFEDVMEIFSQISNTVNIGVALGLESNWIPSFIATITLFLMNGITFIVFR